MAWAETCSVKEKARFCMACEGGEASMSELCRQFGISRKTGYQVLARWRSEGALGLAERSHAPHSSPHALCRTVREAVVALRRAKPTWGPKKLKRRLELDHPQVAWPATSTIGDLLARTGLSVGRKRVRHAAPRTTPLAHCQEANDTWAMDFKGWFRTVDGSRCDPLTIQDQASRYLIGWWRSSAWTARTCGPCWMRRFASSGCPRRCAPTTERRLPRRELAVCRHCRCG